MGLRIGGTMRILGPITGDPHMFMLKKKLEMPSAAEAGSWFGPGWGWRYDHVCAPPAYSPCHYWTPQLYRLWALCHAPREPMYAAPRYPCVPSQFVISRYACPPVAPAAQYGTPESPY